MLSRRPAPSAVTLLWCAAAVALFVVITAAASIRLALIAAVIGGAITVAGYRYSRHTAIALGAVVAVLALAGLTDHSASPQRPAVVRHPAAHHAHPLTRHHATHSAHKPANTKRSRTERRRSPAGGRQRHVEHKRKG